jgi:hypothetical protein
MELFFQALAFGLSLWATILGCLIFMNPSNEYQDEIFTRFVFVGFIIGTVCLFFTLKWMNNSGIYA